MRKSRQTGSEQQSPPAHLSRQMKPRPPISLVAASLFLAVQAPAGEATPQPKATASAVKKQAAPATEVKPAAMPAAPAAAPEGSNADLVYGAYQRGQYKTTFDLASVRAQAGDVKAMTMLGVLYYNALGVKRDYAKASEWYKRASDGGDREAMFELAMMRLSGRGGPVDKQEAIKLLASSAKLGEPKAAYNLALLYLDGQTLPQDVKRAAELLRTAADAGNAEAQ